MNSLKSIAILLLLSLSFLSCTPQANESIIVSELKKEYIKGETIALQIKNNSSKKIMVQSIMFVTFDKNKNEWIDQVYDILNPLCNPMSGSTGIIIKSGNSESITWDPKKVSEKCFNYHTNEGLYKLQFQWKMADDSSEFLEYNSSTFLIN